MESKEKPTKEKRRNNEKRKEKSRVAARSRRSRETEIFTDLTNALPLSADPNLQLDKASVMRLAIAYLRVRDMVNLVPFSEEMTEKKLQVDESIFLKSLEGFLVVISSEGDFVYLSENVSEFLGISQIDLMGQSVYEYSHPCDHDEIREMLSSKSQDDSRAPKSFFIRLKCTLTSKGRSVNLKSATYKVIHCSGHILQSENDGKNNDASTLKRCLVAIGQPIPHPSNIEAPLPRQTFLTKHGLDMKFTHADDEIMMDILGYNSEDLVGKSVYEYHHAMDSDAICSAYKCLFSKGQCETNRYRFLAKTGGFVWVLTQATLIHDKSQKPQSVVCVNYVISGVECKDEIYSSSQLASVKELRSQEEDEEDKKVFEDERNNNCNKSVVKPSVVVVVERSPAESIDERVKLKVDDDGNLNATTTTTTTTTINKILSTPKTLIPASRPQTCTSKIFAPRTEDMNKGFLTFSDDEPGLTMLKDEPDDLTHLAPVAGDVCVPLDDNPFLTDVLDDILLRDNFCLLNDEPSDPFISYNPSPQMLSPNISKASDCSLPSLSSPGDSLGDEDQMSTFMNLQMEDEPELTSKAPYIPMNVNDDLPLLISDDLMWNCNEKNGKNDSKNSSLAQLLCSSLSKHSLKSNDHGGGGLLDGGDDYYNEKNSTDWDDDEKNRTTSTIQTHQQHIPTSKTSRTERAIKRGNSTQVYDASTTIKKSKIEPKEKMSSELLQQLMANNQHRGRPKGKSNWLLDSGGQKAACISQPSDSVLMNLLDDPMVGSEPKPKPNPQRASTRLEPDSAVVHRQTIRKNSISLLDPESASIPSLMDLTQQDYEVNAPVNNLLLQGTELFAALDNSTSI